jgi:menaquinol-cytochrome c reductase iron-sulfur subunit
MAEPQGSEGPAGASASANAAAAPDRRTFQLGIIYGLWAIVTGALSLPAAIYLLWPPRQRKSADWVEAADAAQLPLNAPEQIVFRRNRADGWKITSEKTSAWVVRMSEKDVLAFMPQCTHLGCAYRWDQARNNFLCPCHTSTFGLDGAVLSGPAPRPLDRYEARIEKGKLLIGPSHIRGTKA